MPCLPIFKPSHCKMPTPPEPDRSSWSVLRILNWTTAYFDRHGVDSPRMTAEILLAHALGCRRLDLYLHFDQPLNAEELAAFKSRIQRRIQGEPVAYITGRKGFWSIELCVNPQVLIPRPDTECLVENALAVLDDGPRRVLDLGIGSGAIALALAHDRPHACMVGMDRSADAVAVAAANAKRLALDDRLFLVCADWLSALARRPLFDLIVSNPPYIPTAELPALQREIRLFEPAGALDGGPDGLACTAHLIGCAHHHLIAGGFLLVEIGWDQKAAVNTLIENQPAYDRHYFCRDLAGRDRVAVMQKK